MLSTDSYFIVFMGILVSDILYQTGLLTKLYQRITKLEDKVSTIEEKISKVVKVAGVLTVASVVFVNE